MVGGKNKNHGSIRYHQNWSSPPLTSEQNGFVETPCPLTSVRVQKSSEWTDIQLTKDYWVTFELINDNILSAFPRGIISLEGTLALFKKYDLFLKCVNLDGKKYIEISDYGQITNIPSKRTRIQVSNCLMEKVKQRQLIGHFVYHVPKYIRWMYNIGAMLKRPGIPMAAYDSYVEAVQAALVLLAQKYQNKNISSFLSRRFHRFNKRARLQRYADEILEYMGAINWDLPGFHPENIPNSHPFKSVFDALAILKLDIENSFSQLKDAQSSLLEVSRTAGMAEVANGVLHNVGNVLNSVNVSSNLIRDKLHSSRVGNVAKVAELMAQTKNDPIRFLKSDPRVQQIPDYLTSLAAALENEHQLILQESQSLHEKIDHIKKIISQQQSFGRLSNVSELVAPHKLMEDALALYVEPLARHEISVHRAYAPVAPITIDKHAVLQILLNLINNAFHACKESDREESHISLRLFKGEEKIVKMQVEDNGVGIAPEHLDRVFQHGFTTRVSGHGFGLHSSALAARQLGGRLHVHSDGTGQGAMFTLELPSHPGETT